MPRDQYVPRPGDAPQALIFGAIGTLVETSDLQRRAFNAAFEEAGLGWTWTEAVYRDLLRQGGGRERISRYAMMRGVRVDAEHLHRRKTDLFGQMIRSEGLSLRPGVTEALAEAKNAGLKLAMASSTSRANIDAIFEALGPESPEPAFDLVVDRSMVARGKPAPDAYEAVLERLDLKADRCAAIEDTPESAAAAEAAGLHVVAFPGAFADRSGFASDMPVQDRLDFSALWAMLA